MPLYEYKCVKCKRHTDKIEKVSGPHLKKCPHCGAKVESVITAPAIKFKGSGWYVNDYAGKSAGGDDAKGDKKSDKPPGETKEATAKESSSKESAGKGSSSKGSSEKKTAKKE